MGSIPGEVIEFFFNVIYTSSLVITLAFTQPLTEYSQRNLRCEVLTAVTVKNGASGMLRRVTLVRKSHTT
jgi:hypothetical protein